MKPSVSFPRGPQLGSASGRTRLCPQPRPTVLKAPVRRKAGGCGTSRCPETCLGQVQWWEGHGGPAGSTLPSGQCGRPVPVPRPPGASVLAVVTLYPCAQHTHVPHGASRVCITSALELPARGPSPPWPCQPPAAQKEASHLPAAQRAPTPRLSLSFLFQQLRRSALSGRMRLIRSAAAPCPACSFGSVQ